MLFTCKYVYVGKKILLPEIAGGIAPPLQCPPFPYGPVYRSKVFQKVENL